MTFYMTIAISSPDFHSGTTPLRCSYHALDLEAYAIIHPGDSSHSKPYSLVNTSQSYSADK